MPVNLASSSDGALAHPPATAAIDAQAMAAQILFGNIDFPSLLQV
jgi:hypothetical protein